MAQMGQKGEGRGDGGERQGGREGLSGFGGPAFFPRQGLSIGLSMEEPGVSRWMCAHIHTCVHP